MSFTTLTFALFLPLVFAAHWRAGSQRGQNWVLLIASYVFYGWWDWRFCALIFASTAVDFVLARRLAQSEQTRERKGLLGLSVALNLGTLGTFKYFNFFTDSLVQALALAGVTVEPVALQLILPVGISFYTFQTLGYTIDVYRRELAPSERAVDYFTYVAFFPQLVAGPIERGKRLLPQLQRERSFDPAAASDGARQILWGFFKKVAISDNLAQGVDACYGHTCSGPETSVATVFFALQIYCDFSAYSDIAIGTARLFGVELCRNFAYPYFSQSVAEFWRRWHISLSTWFRDYVYIPLGGSRAGRNRQVMNVLLTFTISGFWHGANWTFVLWGAANGLLAAPLLLRDRERSGPSQTPGGDANFPSLPTLVRMGLTFALICGTWVLFRAESLPHAIELYRRMGTQFFSAEGWHMRALGSNYVTGFGALAATVLLIEWTQRRHDHPLKAVASWPRSARWSLYTVLLWATLLLQHTEINAFIYFQF